jgi:hypothetical protein
VLCNVASCSVVSCRIFRRSQSFDSGTRRRDRAPSRRRCKLCRVGEPLPLPLPAFPGSPPIAESPGRPVGARSSRRLRSAGRPGYQQVCVRLWGSSPGRAATTTPDRASRACSPCGAPPPSTPPWGVGPIDVVGRRPPCCPAVAWEICAPSPPRPLPQLSHGTWVGLNFVVFHQHIVVQESSRGSDSDHAGEPQPPRVRDEPAL